MGLSLAVIVQANEPCLIKVDFEAAGAQAMSSYPETCYLLSDGGQFAFWLTSDYYFPSV
jgi:hypothetical protein